METIGIIGGLGESAADLFYREISIRSRSIKRPKAPLVKVSLPVDKEIEKSFIEAEAEVFLEGSEKSFVERGEVIRNYYMGFLDKSVQCLIDKGATKVVMPCFSLTPMLGSIASKHSISLINPLKALKQKLHEFGFPWNIGIIATIFGVLYFSDYFGATVDIAPTPTSLQQKVTNLVSRTLRGMSTKEEAHQYHMAFQKYAKETDYQLIGCSELHLFPKLENAKTIDLFDFLLNLTTTEMERV